MIEKNPSFHSCCDGRNTFKKFKSKDLDKYFLNKFNLNEKIMYYYE